MEEVLNPFMLESVAMAFVVAVAGVLCLGPLFREVLAVDPWDEVWLI